MTFGRNLRRIRKIMRLTQGEMAKKIGISRSFLGDIEVNRTVPSLKTIYKISNELNISVNELINDNIKIS